MAIVDSHNNVIRSANQIGEIWISSESTVKGNCNEDDSREFNSVIDGSDGSVKYARTGIMGFSASLSGEDNAFLFVVARKEDVLCIRGFTYFAIDIEKTVESSCNCIISGGVCLLNLEGKGLVLLIEIDKESNIYNSIPIIMNTLLEVEGIFVDEMIFGPKGMIKKNLSSSGRSQKNKMASIIMKGKLDSWTKFSCKNPYSQTTIK